MTNAALHVARTGLDAQNTKMQVIANNLANVNTTGFKKNKATSRSLATINSLSPPDRRLTARTNSPRASRSAPASRSLAPAGSTRKARCKTPAARSISLSRVRGIFRFSGRMARSAIPATAVSAARQRARWSVQMVCRCYPRFRCRMASFPFQSAMTAPSLLCSRAKVPRQSWVRSSWRASLTLRGCKRSAAMFCWKQQRAARRRSARQASMVAARSSRAASKVPTSISLRNWST